MNNYLMLLEASTSASGKGSFQMIILMVFSDDSSSEKTAKKRAGDS